VLRKTSERGVLRGMSKRGAVKEVKGKVGVSRERGGCWEGQGRSWKVWKKTSERGVSRKNEMELMGVLRGRRAKRRSL
jgi:hypothetical protein